MTISYNGTLGSDEWSSSTANQDTLSVAIASDVDVDNFIIVGFSYRNFTGDYSGNTNHHASVEGLGIVWERIEEVTMSINGFHYSGTINSLWLGKLTGPRSAGSVITATLDGLTTRLVMGTALFSLTPGNEIRVDQDIETNPVIGYYKVVGYPAITLSGAYVPGERLFLRNLSRSKSGTSVATATSGFTLAWELISAPDVTSVSGDIRSLAEFIISTGGSVTSDPSGTGGINTNSEIADIIVALDEYTPSSPPAPVPDFTTMPTTLPEDDVTETWSWRTAITTSWSSTEQRIRLMPGPIRTVELRYIIAEDEDLVEWQNALRKAALSGMAVPYYQYATSITSDASSGSTTISFNTEATQIRVGDDVLLLNVRNDSMTPLFRTIATINPGVGGTLSEGLTGNINNEWIICPVYDCYINIPQLNIQTVTGDITLSAEVIDRTRPLSRDSVADLREYFNGLLIVRRKTLANITHQYDAAIENFASSFGARLRVSSWSNPRLERSVRFFVPHRGPSVELDRWLQYFDDLAGAHKPFFISSGVKDLELFEAYANGDDFIKVVGFKYSEYYEDDPVYQQLSILFSDNVVREYSVILSSTQVDGNDKITLSDNLPNGLAIIKISYLYRVRLATDQVTVQHLNNRAYFSFAIRGTSN